MTDTTTTERPAKPVWTRCKGSGSGDSNGCGQRIYNDRIDIEFHRQHCPADLERTVAGLARRLDAIEKAEPALPDLDDVAEWPGADEDDGDGPVAFTREDLLSEVDPALRAPEPVPAAAHVNASTYFADEDDPDDDLA